jgi:hypothetical protein
MADQVLPYRLGHSVPISESGLTFPVEMFSYSFAGVGNHEAWYGEHTWNMHVDYMAFSLVHTFEGLAPLIFRRRVTVTGHPSSPQATSTDVVDEIFNASMAQ